MLVGPVGWNKVPALKLMNECSKELGNSDFETFSAIKQALLNSNQEYTILQFATYMWLWMKKAEIW